MKRDYLSHRADYFCRRFSPCSIRGVAIGHFTRNGFLMSDWLLVLGMTLVTFGVRYPVLSLMSRLSLPEAVLKALAFVPVAVLSAIIAPVVLIRDGAWAVGWDQPFLLGALCAVAVSCLTRHLLLTIVVSMGVFFSMQWLIGG